MSAVAAQRRDRLGAAAVALMTLLCAIWGTQQVAVKMAIVNGLPPLLQAASRAAVASLLVIAWSAWREGPAAALDLLRADRSLVPGLLLGAAFTAEFGLLYPGLALTTASRGVLFLYTAPFVTALGAHVLLPNDRLTPVRLLGLLIAFAGVAAAFTVRLGAAGSLRGDALCLGAALLWAISTLLIKRSAELSQARPAKVLLYQIGLSVPVLLVSGLALGEWDRLGPITSLAWACLAYQGVVVAFASYLTWFWLVQIYPAGRLAPFLFLSPVFGVAFGGLLLGEPIGPPLLAGLGAIAVGLRLLNRR